MYTGAEGVKMIKFWNDSSRDIYLIGIVSFTAIFWSLMRGSMVAFEARPQLRIEEVRWDGLTLWLPVYEYIILGNLGKTRDILVVLQTAQLLSSFC